MGLGRMVQMRGVRTAIVGSMGNVAPCVGWSDEWRRLGAGGLGSSEWGVGLCTSTDYVCPCKTMEDCHV